MNIRLKLILTLLLTGVSLNAAKHTARIWDRPSVENNDKALGGYFLPLLEVTQVEIGPDKTILSFHAGYRPEFVFNFTGDSYLMVDSVKYHAIGGEGIDHKIGIDTIRTENRDFKLHFPPLPPGTEQFDFFNGTNFHIHGISDGSARRARLIPSNWRDNNTGDWLIGLFEDCVVYDARFWNYVGETPDQNAKSFEITDGAQTLKVSISKAKDGYRKFKIGNKSFDCSAISGRYLPAYPTKDNRKFRDNGYNPGDSVEFTGWMKDMPDWAWGRSTDYSISVYGLRGEEQSYTACMDSLGRFSMKFPVDNSCEIYADWGRSFLRNVIEPGQRYFLLYDYKLGQTLFMGPDSRVQNELMMYQPQWRRVDFYKYQGRRFDELFHDADSINTVLTHELDSICEHYPTLSDRFKSSHLTNERIHSLGRQLGFAHIPDSIVPYVMEMCMPYAVAPYTLSREFPRFLSDLMNTLNAPRSKTFDWSKFESEIQYTPEEKVILAKVDSLQNVFEPVYDSIPDPDAKEAFRKDHLQRNKELLIKYIQILNGDSRNRVYYPKQFMHSVPHGVAILDSLGFDPVIKDIWLDYVAHELLDKTRSSMTPEIETFLNENITTKTILDKIMGENEKYINIERRASNPVADTSALKGLTKGNELLEKILEPHRGKFVLIDIWGTWCGPCREALSHSTELYERLKDFDIDYIYLANNSGETTWRNVIEEYNVKGENVFHYNLPGDQQSKIERALNIHEFPSYRLVDKDGTLLDINADPRMHGGIETILRNLSR